MPERRRARERRLMRLKFLDTARAIAVLYVVYFHVVNIWHLGAPKSLTQFTQFGGSAVTLFFVISGFSLCLTMGRHLAHPRPMASYVTARIFRIMPLYYIMLALTIWRDLQFRDMTHENAKIISSALMIFNFSPEYAKGIVWASWSVGVEMVFYAVFPFLHRALDTIEKKVVALIAASWATYAVAVFVLPGLEEGVQRSFSYMNFPRNLAVFLVGMIAYDVFLRLERIGGDRRFNLGLVVTAAGLSLLGFLIVGFRLTWGKTLVVDFGLMQAFAYATFIIGLSLLPSNAISNGVTAFYSKVCYSAYLWHPMIIWAMGPLFDYLKASTVNPWAKVAIAYAATLTAVSIVSAASFDLIERPGQNLGKRLLTRFSAGAKPAPAE